MKPQLSPPTCSSCDQPATLVPRSTRFRRADRVLAVDGWIWACTSRCPDPADGTVPYQFTTFELMSWEEARAREAWQARFAEPMPASRRARLPAVVGPPGRGARPGGPDPRGRRGPGLRRRAAAPWRARALPGGALRSAVCPSPGHGTRGRRPAGRRRHTAAQRRRPRPRGGAARRRRRRSIGGPERASTADRRRRRRHAGRAALPLGPRRGSHRDRGRGPGGRGHRTGRRTPRVAAERRSLWDGGRIPSPAIAAPRPAPSPWWPAADSTARTPSRSTASS